MKVRDIINSTARGAKEMTYPNVYDKKNRNMGARKKLRKEKVTLRNSKTGEIFGVRTIVQNAT